MPTTGNGTRTDLRAAYKDRDAWWTVLVVDPLGIRVLPFLLRRQWITPNLLTLTGVLLAVASGAAFLAGVPVAGALLFEASFFVDCLDGKVARMRQAGSPLGAFLDIAGDIVRITWVYAGLCLWLAAKGALPDRIALLPVVAALVWLWSAAQLQLQQRAAAVAGAAEPAAADAAGGPSAGAQGGRLEEWLRRRRLARLPGSVDAAAVALFVAPLTTSTRVMAVVLWVVALGFYLPRSLFNVGRILAVLRASAPPAGPAADRSTPPPLHRPTAGAGVAQER